MTSIPAAECPLCAGAGGRLVFEARDFRVVHADEPGFPAFYRVVWKAHVAEWSDLAARERALCGEAVAAVELGLRDVLGPAKSNIAALGNLVPHLHWHVIARFSWDSHFPSPVWAGARRERDAACEARVEALLPVAETAMRRRLQEGVA